MFSLPGGTRSGSRPVVGADTALEDYFDLAAHPTGEFSSRAIQQAAE
jgi:hypothetical protein